MQHSKYFNAKCGSSVKTTFVNKAKHYRTLMFESVFSRLKKPPESRLILGTSAFALFSYLVQLFLFAVPIEVPLLELPRSV